MVRKKQLPFRLAKVGSLCADDQNLLISERMPQIAREIQEIFYYQRTFLLGICQIGDTEFRTQEEEPELDIPDDVTGSDFVMTYQRAGFFREGRTGYRDEKSILAWIAEKVEQRPFAEDLENVRFLFFAVGEREYQGLFLMNTAFVMDRAGGPHRLQSTELDIPGDFVIPTDLRRCSRECLRFPVPSLM